MEGMMNAGGGGGGGGGGVGAMGGGVYAKQHKGTLPGHLMPGAMFMGLAAWWLYNICRRYAQRHLAWSLSLPVSVSLSSSSLSLSSPSSSSSLAPRMCPCKPPLSSFAGRPLGFWLTGSDDHADNTHTHTNDIAATIPWTRLGEPLAVILLTLIGILVEGHSSHWNLKRAEHSTMYLGFAVAAAVGLAGSRTSAGRVCMPRGAEHILYALAFAGEAAMIAGHVAVDVPPGTALWLAHELLAATALATSPILVLMASLPHSIPAAAAGSYATMLQGMWWCQNGLFFFGPVPSHPSFLAVWEVFVWHATLLALLYLLAMYLSAQATIKNNDKMHQAQLQFITNSACTLLEQDDNYVCEKVRLVSP